MPAKLVGLEGFEPIYLSVMSRLLLPFKLQAQDEKIYNNIDIIYSQCHYLVAEAGLAPAWIGL